MQTIGLIGGMTWESTLEYYRFINEAIKNKLGGLHSAKILLYSVDFAEIEKCQAQGDWQKSAEILANAASRLELAGADFILICTNTMHKVAPEIQKAIHIPLLHIGDATARELQKNHIHKAALLGTKYTMSQDFYKNRLLAHGIDILTPDTEDTKLINNIIYQELCLGKVSAASRKKMASIIHTLKEKGAEAVILGCTEIGMLIGQDDVDMPVYDTTRIHAEYAARQATGNF